MRDLKSKTKPIAGVLPQILTGSSTSAAIDLRGLDEALIVAIVGTATITPSTANKFSLVVKECSIATGTFTAVQSPNLVGLISGSTIGAFAVIDTTAKPSLAYSASYVGPKRYIRVAATESGTAALRVATAVIGGAMNSAPKA